MIRNLLLDELWLEICRFSDKGVLIWHFVITNQDSSEIFLYKLMNECFVLKLQQDCFPSDFNEFIIQLKKTNSIIGGSYPASVLAGCSENCSDVDIFVPNQQQQKEEWQKLYDKKLVKNHQYHSSLIQWFFQKYHSTHMRNSKGYDWAEIQNSFAVSKHYRIGGQKDLIDAILLEKRNLNREVAAFHKFIEQNKEDYQEILKKEPLKKQPPFYTNNLALSIIHTNIEKKKLFYWISQNSDIDLFKLVWDGERLIVGSLLTVKEQWHTQSIMPSHRDLNAYLNALKNKEMNFRFRETSRSIERLWKFQYQKNYQVKICNENLIYSLGSNGTLSFEHGPSIEFFQQDDELEAICLDKECWLNELHIKHFCEHSKEEYGSTKVYYENKLY